MDDTHAAHGMLSLPRIHCIQDLILHFSSIFVVIRTNFIEFINKTVIEKTTQSEKCLHNATIEDFNNVMKYKILISNFTWIDKI